MEEIKAAHDRVNCVDLHEHDHDAKSCPKKQASMEEELRSHRIKVNDLVGNWESWCSICHKKSCKCKCTGRQVCRKASCSTTCTSNSKTGKQAEDVCSISIGSPRKSKLQTKISDRSLNSCASRATITTQISGLTQRTKRSRGSTTSMKLVAMPN